MADSLRYGSTTDGERYTRSPITGDQGKSGRSLGMMLILLGNYAVVMGELLVYNGRMIWWEKL